MRTAATGGGRETLGAELLGQGALPVTFVVGPGVGRVDVEEDVDEEVEEEGDGVED